MPGFERTIYNLIKKNPRLKNKVRDAYQLALSLYPVRESVINQTMEVRKGYFFGFHDKIPWSSGNRYLLANKFSIPNRKITPDDKLTVGIFSGEGYRDFKPLGETKSFNWQQGCMLQWVGDSDELIYNDYDNGQHVAIRTDVNGNSIRKYDLPVAAVSPDGKYGLSYSFVRLARYAPGYGYENGHEDDLLLPCPSSQRLNLVNMLTGDVKILFTLEQIAGISPDPSMHNAFHYFTHALFAPSSRRFVFFHRWIRDMNYVNTRMFSCDHDGNNLFLFPTNGMVSHIGWKNQSQLLAYCSTEKFGDAYTLFEDQSPSYTKKGEGLKSDGHPSYSPARPDLFVTDTYPDRFRLITLKLFDEHTGLQRELARLKSPLQFRDELRCDFHPRWNRDGTAVCFDSAHTGIRSLCTLDLKTEIKEFNK